MLKRLGLIHIGDVHFPDAKNERLADIKDPGFPSQIADLVRVKPLTCVARKFTSVMENGADAILFTGDLTSLGDIGGYRDCLAYLNGLVNFKRWSLDRVHAVPGNHDVERVKVDPAGTDLTSKFAEVAAAWKDLGFPVLSVDTMRQSEIVLPKTPASSVKLFSLNGVFI
jgi:3',5'-cyclic AMP phosphodiesterase CpdA